MRARLRTCSLHRWTINDPGAASVHGEGGGVTLLRIADVASIGFVSTSILMGSGAIRNNVGVWNVAATVCGAGHVAQHHDPTNGEMMFV